MYFAYTLFFYVYRVLSPQREREREGRKRKVESAQRNEFVVWKLTGLQTPFQFSHVLEGHEPAGFLACNQGTFCTRGKCQRAKAPFPSWKLATAREKPKVPRGQFPPLWF